MTERLRGLGFLPILLAPLLVVALAAVRMPLAWALLLFIGGTVVIVALRDRQRD